jgi:4-amino-4-deoxy-L-arabinose transferase-like glycosyltransferase
MKRLLIVASVVVCLCGSWSMLQEGVRRDEKVMRNARMIDTSAQHTQSKGNHYYNTYGYFVDQETGLRFSDSINDSLYRQFERDGNKPIEVSWKYSIDKREQTSVALFYTLFGSLGIIVASVVLIYIAAHEFQKLRKRKKCLE